MCLLMAIDSRVWQLVTEADLVAKAVFVILLVFSILSWAVILSKIRLFRKAKFETQRFLTTFRRRKKVADVYNSLVGMRHTPLSRILAEGYKDLEHLVQRKPAGNPESLLQYGVARTGAEAADYDHVQSMRLTLQRISQEELAKLEKNVTVLATTGNVAPFFGLLGTIWGVMDSFLSIGIRGQANLAVVAPGIAVALIATIVGLAAAIPAVIGYNYCVSQLRNWANQMDNFSLELTTALLKEQ